MPNWVRNRVRFSDKEALKACLKPFGSKGNVQFCLNNIIEMPKELRKTQSPNETEEEAQLMEKKYGYANWYDWACSKWGVKWDACQTDVVDDNTVLFNTPWSTPFPALKEASKKFKSIIIVDYADECYGQNCGRYILCDGEEIAWLNGNSNFSQYVWEDIDDYDDDDLSSC